MADIVNKENEELLSVRAKQREAEIVYAISRLEVRRIELKLELEKVSANIEETNKTLRLHREFMREIK